jgi:hypothetical protein
VATATLSRGAVRIIHRAVDNVFDRLKGRVLGPDFAPSRLDKEIYLGHHHEFSISGIYRRAAFEEGTKPNETVLNSLTRVAESYLDAERERTKARVVNAVDTWLRNAAQKKIKTDLTTVLDGELSQIWGQMTTSVTKIVSTESTTARNMGTLEGVSKVNTAAGVSDPVVFFIIVRDGEACEECTQLHLLGDKITPRVWRLSEVGSGYHKRGDDHPSVLGLHPECRCTLATLLPGYGFDQAGRIRYVGPDHDEFAKQRGGEQG